MFISACGGGYALQRPPLQNADYSRARRVYRKRVYHPDDKRSDWRRETPFLMAKVDIHKMNILK